MPQQQNTIIATIFVTVIIVFVIFIVVVIVNVVMVVIIIIIVGGRLFSGLWFLSRGGGRWAVVFVGDESAFAGLVRKHHDHHHHHHHHHHQHHHHHHHWDYGLGSFPVHAVIVFFYRFDTAARFANGEG